MPAAVQFDTLRYVETLKSAGVSDAQAKAGAEALVVALAESASGLFATKDDIAEIKTEVADIRRTMATKEDLTTIKLEIADIKSELKLLKWVSVTIVAGVISLVAKAFF